MLWSIKEESAKHLNCSSQMKWDNLSQTFTIRASSINTDQVYNNFFLKAYSILCVYSEWWCVQSTDCNFSHKLFVGSCQINLFNSLTSYESNNDFYHGMIYTIQSSLLVQQVQPVMIFTHQFQHIWMKMHSSG